MPHGARLGAALIIFAGSLFGQANPVTPIGPGTVVDDTQMGIFADRAYSTLSVTFGATAATMTLTDASAFPNGEYWVVVCPTTQCGIGATAANGETVFVVSKSGNILTLGATGRRVQSDQTGSATGGAGNPSHASGEAVVLAPGAGQFNRWAAEIASIQSKITNLSALETFFGVSFVTETGTHTISGTPTFSNGTYSALFTGGPVGIGTATPGSPLQVVGTASADQLRVGYDTTNYYKIGRNSADGVLHFQGTQATYNGYNFLSQAGVSSLFIKATGSVGIGTAAPNASAILDLTSTTGALLLPRMTTTQRDALTAVNGMLIYNSTLNKFQGYENGAWASLI